MSLAAAAEYVLLLTAPGPQLSEASQGLASLSARELELRTQKGSGAASARGHLTPAPHRPCARACSTRPESRPDRSQISTLIPASSIVTLERNGSVPTTY